MSKNRSGRDFKIFLFYKKEVTLIFSFTAIASMLVIFLQKITPVIPFFFTEQAKAILKFQLNVPDSALGIECFYVDSKCYGYFGITPSLFRLPFVEFFPNQSFTRISLFTALVLGYFFSIKFLELVWKTVPNLQTRADEDSKLETNYFSKILYLSTVTSLTAGSIFIQLTRNDGYWETLAWAGSLSIIGLYFGFRSIYYHSRWNLALSFFAFLLGANARINVGLLSCSFGLLLYFITNSKYKSGSKFLGLKNLGKSLVFILPLLSALSISYVKFKKITSPLNLNPQFLYDPIWVEVMSKNGGAQFSPKYFLTNLFNYLRFDGITFHNGGIQTLRPDFVEISYFWPLIPGSMKVEPVAGLFGLMPILPFIVICLTLFLYRWSILQSDLHFTLLNRWQLVSFVAASATGLIITLNFVAISNRYLGDFIPLTLVVIAFGSALLNLYLKLDLFLIKIVELVLVLLVSYGVIVSWMLILTKLKNGVF
jgi:hypothetical protein